MDAVSEHMPARDLRADDLHDLCPPDIIAAYFKPGAAVALALSGGPDSMALCRLLADYADAAGGPEIHALTVDHGLRPEAAAEARQVGAWVAGWPHVRHHILTRPAQNVGPARLMEAARAARYRLLADYCRKNRIIALFAAHHLDDQAETLLFRLAKGSGLDGLAAMKTVQPYNEQLSIIRPLLGIEKAQLVARCAASNIPFIADPTNENESFARPRLRAARTVLEREGLSARRLGLTAQRISRAREALEFYTQQTFVAALHGRETDRIVFAVSVLESCPAEIRVRVLLHAMRLLTAAQGADFGYGPRLARLEALCARLFGPAGSEPDFKSATLNGFLFRLDRKHGLMSVMPEKKAP